MADVTITPSNVVPPTANTTTHYQPQTVVAGEAISAGAVVCLLAADGKVYNADANDTTKQNVLGIAGNSAVAAGQRVDIITQSPALAVGAHGVTVGTPLFLSMNPGKLCPFTDLTSTALPIHVAYSASTTTLQIIIAAAINPIP